MATPAQIAASSANAKSVIYAQSLIIRGEYPAELEVLRLDYYATHQILH